MLSILWACSQKGTGFNHNKTSTNENYIPVHKTNDKFISDPATFLRNKINFVVDEEKKKFSRFYWTCKLYEHPYKARFVIAGLQCPVKPLPKVVTSVLKRVYKRKEFLIPKCIFFRD